jgi:hypothetical protein
MSSSTIVVLTTVDRKQAKSGAEIVEAKLAPAFRFCPR